MFIMLEKVFEEINNSEKDIRAVVLTSEGKHFTAGLDLKSAMEIGASGSADDEGVDVSRQGHKLYKHIRAMQR